jgi:hypothetical protein
MRILILTLSLAAVVAGFRILPEVIAAMKNSEIEWSVQVTNFSADVDVSPTGMDVSRWDATVAVPQSGDIPLSDPEELQSEAEERSPVVANGGPVRQASPLHPQLVTPGNFEYLGAFRPPSSEGMRSKFGFGGWAVTYSPDGDPRGADDGFPGSLYLVGFPPEQMVVELTIPIPRRSHMIDHLGVAEILQPFGDITGGLQELLTGDSTEPFMIGGMQVTGGRLHWTLFKYYNVAGHPFPSHGVSSLRIDSHASVRGLWSLGPVGSSEPQWHSYKHAGYIAEIPTDVAERHLSGRTLMSGLQISTGRSFSSQGPALFAYQLPDVDLPPDSSLDAVPLLWYTEQQPLQGHHPADRWTGAAWVTLGAKQAVVFAGRKAHGDVYYGEPRPGDCYEYKGYHGASYEAQLLFYAPEDLIAAADGRKSAVLIEPWYRWDSQDPGGGPDRFMFRECRRDIGGMTYDRVRKLLYLVEAEAGFTQDDPWEPTPVIHVFRLVH